VFFSCVFCYNGHNNGAYVADHVKRFLFQYPPALSLLAAWEYFAEAEPHFVEKNVRPRKNGILSSKRCYEIAVYEEVL